MKIFTSGTIWAKVLTATAIMTTAKQMTCEKEINIITSLDFKFNSTIFTATSVSNV